jgi:hypothetical protein
VNGNNAAPLYKFLKSSKGGFFGDSIKWNFSKFLVDKEGRVVDRYAPTTSPMSIEVTAISHLLCTSLTLLRCHDVTLFIPSIPAEGYQEAAWELLNHLAEICRDICTPALHSRQKHQ